MSFPLGCCVQRLSWQENGRKGRVDLELTGRQSSSKLLVCFLLPTQRCIRSTEPLVHAAAGHTVSSLSAQISRCCQKRFGNLTPDDDVSLRSFFVSSLSLSPWSNFSHFPQLRLTGPQSRTSSQPKRSSPLKQSGSTSIGAGQRSRSRAALVPFFSLSPASPQTGLCPSWPLLSFRLIVNYLVLFPKVTLHFVSFP